MTPQPLIFIMENLYLLRKIIILAAVCVFSTAAPVFAEEAQEEQSYGSVEERRIYALMQEEREKVLQEKKDLEFREKELKTLEISVDKKLAEIDKRLAELKNLRNRIEELLAEKTAEEKKRIKDLSAIYEKMAPQRAALALSGMAPDLATEILANMKAKAAAEVLDMLNKQKTSELSTVFTTIQLE